MDGIFMVLSLVGGLVLFLYGMDQMGDGLKRMAGGKLESILARLTSSPLKGFLLGFFVTAIIQSSSATTVMLVGFVNSGIMHLGQTIGVIFGANLGTTVTAWLLSTSQIGGTGAADILQLFKPSSFTPVLALIGFLLILTAKKDNRKQLGIIFLGFAILMFGMEMMSDAVAPLKDNEAFKGILTAFSNNPIMGILVGTAFTAIIQSSSASVGVLQALALSCVIPFSTAIPIILGQNIGTTITPVISSLSGNTASKRVAAACVYIKMIGVAVVCGIFYILHGVMDFAFMDEAVSPMSIAIVHTLFNIISTVILLPFGKWIEKLATKTFRDKKQQEQADPFATLDERFLNMPGFAVEKSKDLVCEMSRISIEALHQASSLLKNYDDAVFAKVGELEGLVDKYEDKISTYLLKITTGETSTSESKTVTALLHSVGDIERISDHALNIAEAAKEIYDKDIHFSDKATEDLAVITAAVAEIITLATQALANNDLNVAQQVEPLEQVIDRLKRKIKNGHIDRLRQGDCTMEMGFILSDLLNNYERISDHCSNIAVCIIESAHGSLEMHEYLSQLKAGDQTDFRSMYEQYKAKYALHS